MVARQKAQQAQLTVSCGVQQQTGQRNLYEEAFDFSDGHSPPKIPLKKNKLQKMCFDAALIHWSYFYLIRQFTFIGQKLI